MSINTQGSEEVARLYERLMDKRDKLRVQLEEVEAEFSAVALTLKLMGQPAPGLTGLNLGGLTHLDALMTIARANGNVLIAKQAKKLMIKAGHFANSKHASSALFTAINRSGKFRRQSPGKYELVEKDGKPNLIPPAMELEEELVIVKS